MAEYLHPRGVVPRLMAAAQRWQSRAGREPADVGSLPLNREPTREEKIANARVVAEEEQAARHPVLSALGFTDGPAGPVKAMFMGALAKGAPLDAILKAQRMKAKGASADDIYAATTRVKDGRLQPGITFDKAGNAVWEISDDQAQINNRLDFRGHRSFVHRQTGRQHDLEQFQGPLDKILDHPELYEARPDLRKLDVFVTADKGVKPGRHSGAFWPHDSSISIDANPTDIKSPLLHEVQHAIQGSEGWPRGGSPDAMEELVRGYAKRDTERYNRFLDAASRQAGDPHSPGYPEIYEKLRNTPIADKLFRDMYRWRDPEEMYRLYQRLAGETQARNTQTRRYLTPLERIQHPPHTTMDVPEERQILFFKD